MILYWWQSYQMKTILSKSKNIQGFEDDKAKRDIFDRIWAK